jgi:hypothetical protein
MKLYNNYFWLLSSVTVLTTVSSLYIGSSLCNLVNRKDCLALSLWAGGGAMIGVHLGTLANKKLENIF